MDWSFAIERNRDALKRVLAALVAMAGLAGATSFTSPLWGGRPSSDGRVGVAGKFAPPPEPSARPPHKGEVGSELRPTLPRHLHRAVLRLLRPAESAARRLVIVAARGLVLPPVRPRAAKPKPAPLPAPLPFRQGVVTGIWMPPGLKPPASAQSEAPERPSKGRKPCLPLFDPLPRPGAPARPLSRGVPRISVPGLGTSAPARPRPLLAPDDAICAARLHGRLSALAWALDDLPGQARRYARWRMRAAAVGGEAQASRPARPRRLWPLKPGRPLSVGRRAGLSRRPAHAVHEILRDAHALALRALDSLDTS